MKPKRWPRNNTAKHGRNQTSHCFLTCSLAHPCFLVWCISSLDSCKTEQRKAAWRSSQFVGTQTNIQKTKVHTWAAWRSFALSPSAPSQTLCSAPPGRGPTACACRWHHTGPKRGRATRVYISVQRRVVSTWTREAALGKHLRIGTWDAWVCYDLKWILWICKADGGYVGVGHGDFFCIFQI